MNGVAVILELCATGAQVPILIDPEEVPSRITGDIPGVGIALPALRAQKISSVDRQVLSPGAIRHVTQRIQVTCYGETVDQCAELIAAVRKDCADRIGAFAGLVDVTVKTDGEGPQGFDPITGHRAETQDFRVSYNEPR